ncbi:MAG: flap endonuclease [Acidimicrobiia bacterium]|nr:flap endonuclease [Acidimicrobiia bacterium]
MRVHLVDGTYELFRHHFALPPRADSTGIEIAATRGVVASVLGMLEAGATHLAVATDHVVESFRNALWDGYKSGDEMDPDLHRQFPILEDALRALGVTVWPMLELEADDGLASGVAIAAADTRVTQVLVCSPDKDLAQCVTGDRVVQVDRRKNEVRNEQGVIAKFGVAPSSIPDWLALTGDAADGFPGLPGWGAKSSALVLAKFDQIANIPDSAADWGIPVRGADRLAATLAEKRELANLFLDLATLRTTADLGTVDSWRWSGTAVDFRHWAVRLGSEALFDRAQQLAEEREVDELR